MPGSGSARLSHATCSTAKPGRCRAFALRRRALSGRSRPAAPELGVVRRLLPSPVNERRSHFPLQKLLASLRGYGFGAGRSLPVSAEVFRGRERKAVRHAFASRHGDELPKVWMSLASLTARSFGAAQRAPDSMSAFRSDPIRMERSTPNHALQVTAGMAVSRRCSAPGSPGSVTAPAPPPSPAGAAPSPRAALLLPGAPGPPHLSLGSLGDCARTFV